MDERQARCLDRVDAFGNRHEVLCGETQILRVTPADAQSGHPVTQRSFGNPLSPFIHHSDELPTQRERWTLALRTMTRRYVLMTYCLLRKERTTSTT